MKSYFPVKQIDPNAVYDVSDVVAITHLSTPTVIQAFASGALKGTKHGQSVWFTRGSNFLEWLTTNSTKEKESSEMLRKLVAQKNGAASSATTPARPSAVVASRASLKSTSPKLGGMSRPSTPKLPPPQRAAATQKRTPHRTINNLTHTAAIGIYGKTATAAAVRDGATTPSAIYEYAVAAGYRPLHESGQPHGLIAREGLKDSATQDLLTSMAVKYGEEFALAAFTAGIKTRAEAKARYEAEHATELENVSGAIGRSTFAITQRRARAERRDKILAKYSAGRLSLSQRRWALAQIGTGIPVNVALKLAAHK